MRVAIFPFGNHWRKAPDSRGKTVARLVLEPGAVRDRLTREIFVTYDPADATGVLEAAMIKVVAADEADRKIERAVREGKIRRFLGHDWLADAQAKGIITLDEESLLRETDALIAKVIAVDHFAPDEITGKSAIGHNSRPAKAFDQPPPHAAPRPAPAAATTSAPAPTRAAIIPPVAAAPEPAHIPPPPAPEAPLPVLVSAEPLAPQPPEPVPEPVAAEPSAPAEPDAAPSIPPAEPIADAPPIRPASSAAPGPQDWGAPPDMPQPVPSTEPISASIAPVQPPVPQPPSENKQEPADEPAEQPPHRVGNGVHPAE
jgi:Domain of unknown function (DUF1974)